MGNVTVYKHADHYLAHIKRGVFSCLTFIVLSINCTTFVAENQNQGPLVVVRVLF